MGGVETLFKTSADTVVDYAENAYITAGLSANQYMETVTSFSASLLQSLGEDTEAAAKYADQAITDMSDNANKMGSDIATIQNAYQGFAKANYTMLDNLKLGYGGTKEEMERLLADAEAISGIEFDISSYADVVQAIHVIQEEMGIAGATAAEASTTISGSIASMKAAWQNLVTSVAGGADDTEIAVKRFVDSAKTAASNLVPVIFDTLNGIADLIDELAPLIIDKLPQLVETLLPNLISAAGSIVMGLVRALPGLLVSISTSVMGFLGEVYSKIVSSAPQWIASAKNLVNQFLRGLREGFKIIYESMAAFINDNIIQPIKSKVSDFISVGKQVIDSIRSGISSAWDSLVSWFNGLWSNLFGNRTANVTVNRTVNTSYTGNSTLINGSHAGGLDYVPFDGYIAELHRGEMIVTASKAREMREDNNPIQIVVQSVLDGKVIGETAYQYSRNKNRAYGGAY